MGPAPVQAAWTCTLRARAPALYLEKVNIPTPVVSLEAMVILCLLAQGSVVPSS